MNYRFDSAQKHFDKHVLGLRNDCVEPYIVNLEVTQWQSKNVDVVSKYEYEAKANIYNAKFVYLHLNKNGSASINYQKGYSNFINGMSSKDYEKLLTTCVLDERTSSTKIITTCFYKTNSLKDDELISFAIGFYYGHLNKKCTNTSVSMTINGFYTNRKFDENLQECIIEEIGDNLEIECTSYKLALKRTIIGIFAKKSKSKELKQFAEKWLKLYDNREEINNNLLTDINNIKTDIKESVELFKELYNVKRSDYEPEVRNIEMFIG